ncbi:hypothetical protein L218DRAFT_986074 [Marasmius fiardii PR-910]|nr:hypothetical protein L218DRAFT_986074 [Marasmius fiardii PR-910]
MGAEMHRSLVFTTAIQSINRRRCLENLLRRTYRSGRPQYAWHRRVKIYRVERFRHRHVRNACKSVSQVVYGAVGEEEDRVSIARTLRGSLYYLSLRIHCPDPGDSPLRTVNAKTRLYSPHGLGTSVDLVWSYHYRARMMFSERSADLWAKTRAISDCNSAKPRTSLAVVGEPMVNGFKARTGTVKLIRMMDSKDVTAAQLGGLERCRFGGEGWLSPRKIFEVIAYAGTVGHYEEELRRQLLKKPGLDKFKFFNDETDGKKALTKEEKKAKWVNSAPTGVEKDGVCVPMHLLALAKGGVQ